MLIHERLYRRKRIVIHLRLQAPGRSLHHDVLVHLVVSALRIAVGELLVTPQPVLEEAQVPVRVIGMLQPLAHEHETPVDPVARMRFVRIRNDPPNFRFSLRWEHLVGVEEKDPLILERQILQCPVLLLGPSAFEIKLHDFRTGLLGNLFRPVRALRIDNEHLISPIYRVQAPRQNLRFVLDGNNYRYRYAHRFISAGPLSLRCYAARITRISRKRWLASTACPLIPRLKRDRLRWSCMIDNT